MAAEKHNNTDNSTGNASSGRTPAGSQDISFDSKAFVGALLRKLTQLSYIKPGEVPNIDLYMDQVTTFMDEHLSDIKRYEDDKTLTKTMINNYTKNKLLPHRSRRSTLPTISISWHSSITLSRCFPSETYRSCLLR